MTNTIKIVFYGNTAAGKTSFLYRLVSLLRTLDLDKSKFAFVDSETHKWYEEITQKLNGKTAVTRDEFAQNHADTLAILEKFGTPNLVAKAREAIYKAWEENDKKEVPQVDNNLSTSIESGIIFKMQNDFFHPERKKGLPLIPTIPSSDWIKFCFRDVVGEKTRDLWAKAKVAGSDEEKEAKEILSGNSYLVFVLDPTQSNNEPTAKNRVKLNDDEVKLVGAIADVMPKALGNNPHDIVPMLFVLTHKDLKSTVERKQTNTLYSDTGSNEHKDLKIVTDKEANEWFDKAHESLKTHYRNVYTDASGNPIFDNRVHDRKKNCFYLSTTDENTSENEILAVLKRIGEIEGLRESGGKSWIKRLEEMLKDFLERVFRGTLERR